MHIDKETRVKLVELLTKRSDKDEIEALYTHQPLMFERFDTIVRYLRENGRGFQEIESVDVVLQLDGEQYRATAVGRDNVQKVLQAIIDRKSLMEKNILTCMKKSRIGSVIIAQYDMKVTCKQEIPVTSRAIITQVAERLGSNARTVRVKRRFSSITDDNMCRFDMTAVNQTTLQNSNNSQTDVHYEAEVEVISKELDKDNDPMVIIMSIFRAFSILLKLIQDSDYIMSSTERNLITSRYSTLVKVRDKFIGPKPVTLEMRHLAIEAGPGSDSVRFGYTVTDKADGERVLLFVDSSRKVFLIDDRLTVRDSGLVANAPSAQNTLLDGEYIKLGSGRRIIAVFDAYFVDNGTDIRALPLMIDVNQDLKNPKDRVSHMKRFVDAGFTKTKASDADVMTKEFRLIQYGGDDIFNQVRYMVRKRSAGNMPYETDGLIFTPAKLAVGANDEKTSEAFTGGTWIKAFKWKPPEFNSIDFLVRFPDDESFIVKKDPETGDDAFYRRANLYVGTRASTMPISLLDYIRALSRPPPDNPQKALNVLNSSDGKQQQNYIPRLFEAGNTNTLHICHFKMDSADGGQCRCANGDIINNDTIIEMSYACNRNEHQPDCWKPMRVRSDKTERYKASNSVSGGAVNDINTAMSVWRSICYPISEQMLTGIKAIASEDLSAAVDAAALGSGGALYYIRDKSRDQSASFPMMLFHNYWVKRQCLIMKFSKLHSLIDLGCGRGGEINKWVDAGFIRVLGIDPIDDNLTNPGPINQGACARALCKRAQVYSEKRGPHSNDLSKFVFPKMVFLRMDASKVINTTYIESLKTSDPETASIARVLWGIEEASAVTLPELRNMYSFAAQGFDLASCMFAVHYFFDTMERLRSFATNVANQLRPGGHFFGACLDGKRVQKALGNVPYGQRIEGRKDGRLLWSITKLYDGDANPAQVNVVNPALKNQGVVDDQGVDDQGVVVMKKKKPGNPRGRKNKSGGGGREEADADLPTGMAVYGGLKASTTKTGMKIRVFVESIGQPLDEYLVDYELLKEVLAEQGIFPMKQTDGINMRFPRGGQNTGFFDELYGDLTAALDGDQDDWSANQNGDAAGGGPMTPGDRKRMLNNIQVIQQMSDAEKEYSFMHRWFVFTKR